MAMPKVRSPIVNTRRPRSGTYQRSSPGSIWVFACSPIGRPSASNTADTIARPAGVGRSAPTIVATPASRAAAATVASASSSAARVTSGTGRAWSRWPGRPVSGRHTIAAPSRPAASIAATAAGTASSSVAVSGVEATAIRMTDIVRVYRAAGAGRVAWRPVAVARGAWGAVRWPGQTSFETRDP